MSAPRKFRQFSLLSRKALLCSLQWSLKFNNQNILRNRVVQLLNILSTFCSQIAVMAVNNKEIIASIFLIGDSKTVISVVAFSFFTQNLQMISCQSVSAVRKVNTLIGGGDTQTLTAIIDPLFNFLHTQAVGTLKDCSPALALLNPMSHLVKLSLPNI